MDNLLAAPPRDPPPGVTELEELHDSELKKLTFREQMAMHSKNPTCYFAMRVWTTLAMLDNFNAVGECEMGRREDIDVCQLSSEKDLAVFVNYKVLYENKIRY